LNDVSSCLLTGQEDRQLVDALRDAIHRANCIEIAVSFIQSSGLSLIFRDLEAALQGGHCQNLTILTSDYLCITDPDALRRMLLLADLGADLFVYQVPAQGSFHLKTYLFLESDDNTWYSADAFIGSSNLSRTALTSGLEWNYHLSWPNDYDSQAQARIEDAQAKYKQLLASPQVCRIDELWLSAYELRRKQSKVKPLVAAFEAEEPVAEPLAPRKHQKLALDALARARQEGTRRGLVVLATGLGKTILAAFDALQAGANRVLFVAHREEILIQARDDFIKVHPKLRAGLYTGKEKALEADMLFASVQTLARATNLGRLDAERFDYIVIDEFHHAAAASYRRLMSHFSPAFLLGLTATPERTDEADILRLCEGNLIYRVDLFDGIASADLAPFHYYGIYDKAVDYTPLPWRNGRFDPDALTAQLATLKRARHVLSQWKSLAGQRTLAFCVSRKHAEHMADHFIKAGVNAAAVYAGSALSREAALAQLKEGVLSVIFSVDLFNEGMNLPEIDTVLMLRPTESSILFLQQLGRGLRTSPGKTHVVVLDFVGNHHSFINRPLLFLNGSAGKDRKAAARAARQGVNLPDGCFVNYDLAFVEFLEQLANLSLEARYHTLSEGLGRRPTLLEFAEDGADLQRLRLDYGSWWEFLAELGQASEEELAVLESYAQWFRDLALAKLSRSYKLVLLQTLLQQACFSQGAAVSDLALWARAWFETHSEWQADLPASMSDLTKVTVRKWQAQWTNMPVTHWCKPEASGYCWFELEEGFMRFSVHIEPDELPIWQQMTQEVLNWRLSHYQAERLPRVEVSPAVTQKTSSALSFTEIAYFPDLKIACGHFKAASDEVEIRAYLKEGYGTIHPKRSFVAVASGNSMNGGKFPIQDGDYLLMEAITPDNAGKISDQIVAIERQDVAGDNQYLLRKILKNSPGDYTLRASNPDYSDMSANEEMMTFARLKTVVDPEDLQFEMETTTVF